MLIDSRCISSLLSKENAKNSLWFCKDKHVKKRQLRFDVAKVAVLRCKIAVFTTQNNHFLMRNSRFCNVLIINGLS